MGRKCNKCGYERKEEEIAPDYECPKCGIIYDKSKLKLKPLKKARPKNTNKPSSYIGKQVIKKHIDKAVSEILQPGEVLLGSFHGQAMSDGGYGLQGRYKGGISLHDYLLVTDTRVILWARGLLSGSTDGFLYADISSVEESKGVLLGEIVLNIQGSKERMRSMVKTDVPIAAKMIREQIQQSRNKRDAPVHTAQESIPDQIRKLASLRDDGILTESEFTKKKTALLEKM